MRKLATIRKIDELRPIEGADAIECAIVGGWKVVAQKGLYNVGDLAVYFEIDSWIPTTIAPFLSKGKEPREFEGIKGERLKTIKLRGQLSQGLLMPLDEACKNIESELFEGLDVSVPLGVVKWEKPMNAQLAGIAKGDFPSLVPKTDQERVQNLKQEIDAARGMVFEVTEKLEGSSMTCYIINGEFGVCSRNLDLKRDENNSFWKVAIDLGIEEKLRAVGADIAIQGELIGPGIQGNIYKLSSLEYRIFDVYKVMVGGYMDPEERRAFVDSIGLTHVPVITGNYTLNTDVDGVLSMAEYRSTLHDTEREGIVFKEVNGGMSFKAISNRYLINEK